MYLAAFIAANLLVKHFGAYGLWFSSFLLIPFDFICRCIFHETWNGWKLVRRLLALTLLSALITVAINHEAQNIALASVSGFVAAQAAAGLFYQAYKSKSYFFKVNLSDLLAIVFDSFFFQVVAFGSLDLKVTAGQIVIKFLGGLIWYFLIFKTGLNEKILANRS